MTLARSHQHSRILGWRPAGLPGWVSLLAVFLAPWPSPSTAATISLNTGCTLAEAIESANDDAFVDISCTIGSGADTIVLVADVDLTTVDNSSYSLGNNGLPVIRSDITVDGRGHAIRRSSSTDFRLFHVASSGSLTLRDVTLEDGEEDAGGCIYVWDGALELQRSVVRSCEGDRGAGIMNNEGSVLINETLFADNLAATSPGDDYCSGGAIDSYGGELTITRSTFSTNWAFAEGAWGGAVSHTGGTLTIENSTFSGNLASSHGGAIAVRQVWFFPPAVAQITHSTFRGNISTTGGGISRTAGEVTLTASVLENAIGGNCDGTILDGGDNFGCLGGPDVTGLDTTLSYNGGPTPTHALLSDSNAIDAAGGCSFGTDQRGAGRMASCDAGAFEQLGCPLFEMLDQTINFPALATACHSAILGPDLIIEDTGSLDLRAGYMAALYEGFKVEDGGLLRIIIHPSYLP